MTDPAIVPQTISLAGYIDHTLLKAETTPQMVRRLCEEALMHQFKAVCLNSDWVATAVGHLKASPVSVCAVIGFPLGACPSPVKALEAELACAAGAHELDMVIPVGALKAGQLRKVHADIQAVREAGPQKTVLKVIIETALLEQSEITSACEIACQAGADFVKTSTGFAGGGATVADVALMRRVVGPRVGVKASGGIKDAATARAMIAAGANRIGTSSGVAILQSAGSESDQSASTNVRQKKEIP